MNETRVHYINDDWKVLLASESFDILVKPVKNGDGEVQPQTDVIVRIHHILVDLDDGTTVNVPCKFDAYQVRADRPLNDISVKDANITKFGKRNYHLGRQAWSIGPMSKGSFTVSCGNFKGEPNIYVKKSSHDLFKIDIYGYGLIIRKRFTIGYIPINGCNFVYIEEFVPIAEKRAGGMNKLMIKRIDEGHTCEFHVLANLEENNKKSLIKTFVDAFLTKPELPFIYMI